MRRFNNILVTGGAGFIGSAFVRYALNNDGFSGRVITLDKLTYAGHLINLSSVENNPRHVFVQNDICDAQAVAALCQAYHVDAMVNFAAESHVDRSISGPKAFMDTNIGGTFNLLDVARTLGDIHFHQVSTDEVFGSLGKTGLFTETSSYDPRSPYSASKAAADHLVRAYYHTYNLPVTLSNCSNNYGPYQYPEKLIPLMIGNALNRKALPVYGNGSNVRDWLYVDDHVDAIWQVLMRGTVGESYNVGGYCELTNLDLLHQLLRIISKISGCDVTSLEGLIEFVKDRPGHDQRYAIDAHKIKNELGWTPAHKIESGLETTVQWYMDHEQWAREVQGRAHP